MKKIAVYLITDDRKIIKFIIHDYTYKGKIRRNKIHKGFPPPVQPSGQLLTENILEMLKYRPCTLKDITDNLEVSESYARITLYRLVKRNIIIKVDGEWRLINNETT